MKRESQKSASSGIQSSLPTRAEVSKFLKHESGILYWKVPMGSRARAGDIAGSSFTNGYLRIKLNGQTYLQHRVIWLLVHGEWPKTDIDHINGDPKDNKPENLRLCTPAQNQMNRRASNGRLKGVILRKKANKFEARIIVNGREQYLGLHKSEIEAARAYDAACVRFFGDFAKPNDYRGLA